MTRLIMIAGLLSVSGCAEPPEIDQDRVAHLSELMGVRADPVWETVDLPTPIADKCEALEVIKKQSLSTVEAKQEFTPPAVLPVDEFSDWYVVEWTQQGCPPCRQWETVEKPQIGMAVRAIDIHAEPVLARQHRVVSTPTLQLCSRSDRKVKARWVGYTSAATIKQKARQLKQKNRQVSVIRQAYQPVSYGSHWSIGTARNPRRASRSEAMQHLAQDHNVSYQQMQSMSTQQLLSMHDSLHQGRWR